MKIAYITNTPANNYDGWSGSYKAIYDSLNKITKTDNIVIKRNLTHKICNVIVKFLSFGKIKHSKIDSYFIAKEVNLVKDRLKEYDLLFLPAQSEILGSKMFEFSSKIIYLSDATYNLMNGYYFAKKNLIESKIREFEEEESIKKANHIIYASEWAAKNAIIHYKADVSKISIIPFGAILPDKYKSKKREQHIYNLLLVGSDWQRKGVDIAIETVKKLNNSYKKEKFYLTIVGVTENDAPLNVEFPSYINFIGKLNKNNPNELKKLVEIYNNSDIFILPTHAECAGIVFSEASMYGLPSITYKTGGTASYVYEDKNGFLISQEKGSDAFVKLIKDIINNGRLDELSSSSRKMYEDRLNWMEWEKKVKKIIPSLYCVKENENEGIKKLSL